jgi:hypothetical protein
VLTVQSLSGKEGKVKGKGRKAGELCVRLMSGEV